MTKRCLSGSISGMPEWLMLKCKLLGVIVPLSKWCGVRACDVRVSPLGLLKLRTTSFSNRDGVCNDGVIAHVSRLQGSSLRGSAAALIGELPTPVDMAPARTIQRPSSARRSSRPLPATGSSGGGRRRLPLVLACSSHEDFADL